MKKIIIPRRDHEVYFIPRTASSAEPRQGRGSSPVDFKTKLTRSFIAEQLDRLHPGFSASSCVDLQRFVFNNTHWIMATVMEAETFAEYKILNKGTVFYTNTSIAAHKKDFLNGGINIIDDERIGFDTEKNEPVSVPLETKIPEPEPDEASSDPAAGTKTKVRLKNIPPRHGVFGRKTPRWRITAVIASAVLLLLSAVFIPGEKKPSEVTPVEIFTEAAEEMRRLPRAVEILAGFSVPVVEAGGKMEQWQYNEDLEPFLVIRMRGVDLLTAHQICAQYDYLLLQDIQEVRYSDGEPYLTLYVNAVRTGYAISAAANFPSQSFILPVITGLANDLRQEEIAIVSETLPASGSGNNFYTVTYTANGRNLVRSLDIITAYCCEYPLKIKRMDVSINSGNNNFTVVCSLAQRDISFPVHERERGESVIIRNDKIPAAFGFKENLTAIKQATASGASIIKTPEKDPEAHVLGTIRDGYGRILFYRDTSDGKIKVRGNP